MMQVYKITRGPMPARTYKGTREEGHELMKAHALARPFERADMRMELVEIRDNKPAIIGILNGFPPVEVVLKTWALTPRGGLVEVSNGE
jgi:hypothetical protein